MKKLLTAFILLSTACFSKSQGSTYNIGGYFENWAQYRTGYNNEFACTVDSLSPYINGLDTLYYAFAFFRFGYDEASLPPYVANKTYYKDHGTSDWGIYPSEWNDLKSWNHTDGNWNKLMTLKNTYPDLKLMLSIGGWSFSSLDQWYSSTTIKFFSEMASNPTYRNQFIASCIAICMGNYVFAGHTYSDVQFDGIDIDWEFPASSIHGGSGADFQGYYDLLKNLYTQLKAADPNKLVTIACPVAIVQGLQIGTYTPTTGPRAGVPQTVDPINDPDSFFRWYADCSAWVDRMNIMAYDYYGAGYSATTADNTPLNSYPNSSYYSIKQTLENYINAGVPASKMILGLASYGHTFQGVNFNGGWDPSQTPNGPGCTYTGPDAAGPLTQQAGFFSYIEISKSVPTPGSPFSISMQNYMSNKLSSTAQYRPFTSLLPRKDNSVIISDNKSPSTTYYEAAYYNHNTSCYYAFNTITGKWVSFDTPLNGSWMSGNDVSTIEEKCNYAKSQGLGGVMLWALDLDYYTKPEESILKTMVNTMNK